MARRILLLITDLEIGGTPTVVRELAIRLNHPPDIAIEVACLAKWGPVADQLRDAGVRVTAFGAHGPGNFPLVVAKLRRLIRDGKFDTVFSFLIHANTVAAASAMGGRGVRFIQSIQTTQHFPRWHWWLQSLVHFAAERVVVPSASAAISAQTECHIAREKLLVIPNAVDVAQFADLHPPIDVSPLPIGFLGRLDPVKRVGDLVCAVGLLRDRVRLHIFGEGPDRRAIVREISRLGLRDVVTLHGVVARPQDAIQQMGLLALPSEAEGFGLVLIEAMAAGVPVVASDVKGIRDVVRNGTTGILVAPGSPDALARGIEAMLEKPWLRDRYIAAGRMDVRRRFGWDAVLTEYRRLLRI